MNRSMFTKSDRSVGLGGTDDWWITLPTDMIVGQKEVGAQLSWDEEREDR